jgi:hypothetical protein
MIGKLWDACKRLAGWIRTWQAEYLLWMTTGRVVVGVYLVLIVIAACFIPGSVGDVHYMALRYLGPNTRLTDKLLVAPANVSLEDRFRLAREREHLEGQYVRQAVCATQAITPDNVRAWPELNGEEAAGVELDAEPDWMFLNQGAIVEFWVGDKPKPEHALVLAIVPSGNKWLALLRKKDLAPDSFGTPKQTKTLRVEVLPEKPKQATATETR